MLFIGAGNSECCARMSRLVQEMQDSDPVHRSLTVLRTLPPPPLLCVAIRSFPPVNFGSDEGPWNHSSRLEHRLQTRLRVVGIVDPAIARGQAVLDAKALSFVAMAYQDCRLVKSLDEFVEGMQPQDTPHVVIIGSPPAFHGSDL